MIQIKDKLDIHYAVKGNPFEHKEVDEVKRTVDLVANTYLFYDSDGDVLMPGCAKKSITERGPKSEQPGKIKHCLKQCVCLCVNFKVRLYPDHFSEVFEFFARSRFSGIA